MNSMLIVFFLAVSTAYCSVLPIGLGGLGLGVPGGVVLGTPAISSSIIAGPLAAPIIGVPGIGGGAVLAGPAGTVVTKNGVGLGLGLGGIGLKGGLL